MIASPLILHASVPAARQSKPRQPANRQPARPAFQQGLTFSGAVPLPGTPPRSRLATLVGYIFNIIHSLKADTTLYQVSELTPERLRRLGDIQGIIFDLDDTLVPLLSGRFAAGIIPRLKALKQAGFNMGIVTNNIQPQYCQQIRDVLSQEGLLMPFIEDARKPCPSGFEEMRRHFNILPEQTVVIGDGIWSDIRCAKNLGMKTARARWLPPGWLRREPLLFLWDAFISIISFVRHYWNPQKKLLTFDFPARLKPPGSPKKPPAKKPPESGAGAN